MCGVLVDLVQTLIAIGSVNYSFLSKLPLRYHALKMTVVAKVNFFVTDHGEKVANELNHQDNWYFTAQLTWQGNN